MKFVDADRSRAGEPSNSSTAKLTKTAANPWAFDDQQIGAILQGMRAPERIREIRKGAEFNMIIEVGDCVEVARDDDFFGARNGLHGLYCGEKKDWRVSFGGLECILIHWDAGAPLVFWTMLSLCLCGLQRRSRSLVVMKIGTSWEDSRLNHREEVLCVS